MKTILKSILTIFIFSISLILAQEGPLVAGEGEKKVITSGYGKNPDEALTQALRNAVEEAVGTYMTSTTRIENDDIIEDKILSLSRGFIKDFKKLAEMKVEDETKVTVAVIVTKTQILETLKASGVKVEIKGGLLFAQVSQEKEQMEDEAKIIREYTKNIPQEHPFDYSMEYDTPVPQSDSRFKIPLKIKVSVNQNYHNQYANLKSFLNEISVEKSDPSKSYYKRPTKSEIEKINQKYVGQNSFPYIEGDGYSDMFKNSSFSPCVVMLHENQGEIAYRLLNEHSITFFRHYIEKYFYNIRFTVNAQSTFKSTIRVNILLSSPRSKINEGKSIRLEGYIGYKYKSGLQHDNFSIYRKRRIDQTNYKTVNINDGNIIEDEFLTLSFDLFVDETFMASLTSLEVAPPLPWDGGPVTDIDGNTYKTVKIGDQIWMAENLKVTHYRNGDAIPTGHSNSEWTNLSTGAYAVYDNNKSNADTYGYLYNWYAVYDARELAPEGWHVPTNAEWATLINYLGNEDTGSKLAGSANLWYSGNLKNNAEFGTSGFNALPGGYRYNSGGYNNQGSSGYFWSSTESNSYTAWNRLLSCNNSGVRRDRYYNYSDVGDLGNNKHCGFSVRCVRD